jgi:predicted lipid-binding transport protein (Tim44 family)
MGGCCTHDRPSSNNTVPLPPDKQQQPPPHLHPPAAAAKTAPATTSLTAHVPVQQQTTHDTPAKKDEVINAESSNHPSEDAERADEQEETDQDGLRKFEKRRPPPIKTNFSKKT